MQTFCTQVDSCIHFFPGMGFRPAVATVQRDQYGDHAALVVGDDSPVEGKVPPGWMMTGLPVDPYGPLGGAPILAGLTPAALSSGSVPGPAFPVWGGSGSGGSGGSVNPGLPGLPGLPGNPAGPGGGTPGTPRPPVGGDSSEPPTTGDTSTQPPGGPDLPPLAPVPGPEAGLMLVSALVILTLMQAVRRRIGV